jgi:hypothetical protein
MKINIEVSAIVTVEFDENSKEFKELFENYRKHFFNHLDEKDFAEDIARAVAGKGVYGNIEGVGAPLINGIEQVMSDGTVIYHPINIHCNHRYYGQLDFDSEILSDDGPNDLEKDMSDAN